jgi:hypothetical protein
MVHCSGISIALFILTLSGLAESRTPAFAGGGQEMPVLCLVTCVELNEIDAKCVKIQVGDVIRLRHYTFV